MNGKLTEVLDNIYYNLKSPASFSNAKKIFIEARKILPNITESEIQKYLNKQYVYTLHKKARKNFIRNPVVAEAPLENFQADLIDYNFNPYTKFNEGYNYILTVIDVFSRKAWAIPIKNKSGKTVTEAMEKVIKINTPLKLQTDKGKEFENSNFKKLMQSYAINHFFTKTTKKCAIVEIFNKTLKNKLHQHMTRIGKYRYIDSVDDAVNSYNNTEHSSIKMAPNDVNFENTSTVFKNLYNYSSKREMLKAKKKNRKFATGDTVRQKYNLKFHEKGYYPNWTDKIYKVVNIVKGVNKPYFHLEDEKGKKIDKRFYQEEIQKIDKETLHLIEKIVGEKFIGKKKFYKVRWKNHDEAFDSWIEAKDLVYLNKNDIL